MTGNSLRTRAHYASLITCRICLLVLLSLISMKNLTGQVKVDLPQHLLSGIPFSDTVYMAPTGDDRSPGTREFPVRTFDRALELLPFGGPNGEPNGYGLIRLLPGRYLLENGFQQRAHQWENNGKFRQVSVEGIGEVVVGGTSDRPAEGHLLHLMGEGIFVKNIRLKYGKIHGLLLAQPDLAGGPQEDILIQDVRVDSVRGFSMLLSGTERVLLERCTSAYGARLDEDQIQEPCQWPSGIKFIYSRHATIRHSEIHGTRGEGLNFHNTTYGLAEFNDLHDNPSNVYLDNSAGIILRNNRIYGTPGRERNWLTCPSQSVDSIPPIGILIANEGACPEGLSPFKDQCATDCRAIIGGTRYRYRDVDSVFIYNNLFHQVVSAVAFWEGVTGIIGINCISNVFVFHNTVIASNAPKSVFKRGMFDFFFPAAYNLITNSNFSRTSNIRIEANIISYAEAGSGKHPPVRMVLNQLFPVPMDVRFDNNLWPVGHSFMGANGEVRTGMPVDLELDSLDAWLPCPGQEYWIKPVNNDRELTVDHSLQMRSEITNAGAFEYRETCRSATGTKGLEGNRIRFTAYPNPADDILWLRIPLLPPSSLDYTITDLAGKVLLRGKAEGEEQAIQLDALVPGLYFITLSTPGKAPASLRFIRQ